MSEAAKKQRNVANQLDAGHNDRLEVRRRLLTWMIRRVHSEGFGPRSGNLVSNPD